MADPRQKRLANLLVTYSTEVQAGEWVGILGDVNALPILRNVYDAVLEAGGHPALMLSDEYMTRSFYKLWTKSFKNSFFICCHRTFRG